MCIHLCIQSGMRSIALVLYFTFNRSPPTQNAFLLQIIEACLISLITSVVSFGLPLLRKCSPCPEADPDSGIECPRPPGMYGNYVNVRPALLLSS